MASVLATPLDHRPASSPRAWLARNAGLCLLVGAVVLATALRLVLRAAGPDLDSDVYAHAQISRRMLADWREICARA
jgi:hypothetical protein